MDNTLKNVLACIRRNTNHHSHQEAVMVDLYHDANGLPNWDFIIIDVVDCGCCPLDTIAAELTLRFITDQEYTEDTPEVRNTIDTVYNAFKWWYDKAVEETS